LPIGWSYFDPITKENNAMKIRTVLLILGHAGILVSCIPSLYPLYRVKDLLLDENLEGLYETDDNEYWKIRKFDPDNAQIFPDGWKKYNSK